MKIMKLGHSCVLVSVGAKVGLFDPGVWSNISLIESVGSLDEVIYTHAHPDHFDASILIKLANKFPELTVVCNSDISGKVQQAGIKTKITEESKLARPFKSPHEDLPFPGMETPSESGYHFGGLFSHPGDSHSFSETTKVLAMPFIGPWGKTGDAVKKVVELKPEYVIPIHDWHYTEEARAWLSKMLESSFSEHGIKVLSAKSGIEHEIAE